MDPASCHVAHSFAEDFGRIRTYWQRRPLQLLTRPGPFRARCSRSLSLSLSLRERQRERARAQKIPTSSLLARFIEAGLKVGGYTFQMKLDELLERSDEMRFLAQGIYGRRRSSLPLWASDVQHETRLTGTSSRPKARRELWRHASSSQT